MSESSSLNSFSASLINLQIQFPAMSNNRLCGPVTSPSTWPLDNVPALIMDGIIEEFRRFDEAEAHKSRSKPTPKKEEPYFGHFPDRPRIKVLGPHTSKLSLVSKSFRQATTRGIFTCVDLKTSRSIHLIKAQLGSGARSHVTCVLGLSILLDLPDLT